MVGSPRRLPPLALAALLAACAATPPPTVPSPPPAEARRAGSVGARAAEVALAMRGRPYRYGGASPRGFDCSGLVVYSYARAGVPGLPRTAAALARRARPVPLGGLAAGDLLFFEVEGRRGAHVALYVGGNAFVHAPSSGGRVETRRLDHVYWAPRLRRAGRLAD